MTKKELQDLNEDLIDLLSAMRDQFTALSEQIAEKLAEIEEEDEVEEDDD